MCFFWNDRTSTHSVQTLKHIGCAVRAVCMPSVCSDNSLHATTTPWALCDRTVNHWPELCGNVVACRGRSSEMPWSPLEPHDISMLWKMWNYLFYFCSIFVWSHDALRNFKSPCQCSEIVVECDSGITMRYHRMAHFNGFSWFSVKCCT